VYEEILIVSIEMVREKRGVDLFVRNSATTRLRITTRLCLWAGLTVVVLAMNEFACDENGRRRGSGVDDSG
jgi:hypothetical protein